MRRPVLERVAGLPLLVLPGVLNPVVFRSGVLLAETVAEQIDRSELRVLDMGCGSGVVSVLAARAGARVVAVDINPEAVRCTRANLEIHNLTDRAEVRQGDLFDALREEAFDLVAFNPPFFRGSGKKPIELALFSDDVRERFAEGLGTVLAEGGECLMVLSTEGESAAMLAALETLGYGMRVLRQRHLGNEILTVYGFKL